MGQPPSPAERPATCSALGSHAHVTGSGCDAYASDPIAPSRIVQVSVTTMCERNRATAARNNHGLVRPPIAHQSTWASGPP